MIQQQLDITFARKARDKGIEKAITNADRVSPSWSEKAYALLKEFLHYHKGEFMGEDFRLSVTNKIESPPHNRAFGGVFMRAAKAGIIERVRYAPVKSVNCHRANASVWRRT